MKNERIALAIIEVNAGEGFPSKEEIASELDSILKTHYNRKVKLSAMKIFWEGP